MLELEHTQRECLVFNTPALRPKLVGWQVRPSASALFTRRKRPNLTAACQCPAKSEGLCVPTVRWLNVQSVIARCHSVASCPTIARLVWAAGGPARRLSSVPFVQALCSVSKGRRACIHSALLLRPMGCIGFYAFRLEIRGIQRAGSRTTDGKLWRRLCA